MKTFITSKQNKKCNFAKHTCKNGGTFFLQVPWCGTHAQCLAVVSVLPLDLAQSLLHQYQHSCHIHICHHINISVTLQPVRIEGNCHLTNLLLLKIFWKKTKFKAKNTILQKLAIHSIPHGFTCCCCCCSPQLHCFISCHQAWENQPPHLDCPINLELSVVSGRQGTGTNVQRSVVPLHSSSKHLLRLQWCGPCKSWGASSDLNITEQKQCGQI